MSDHERPDAWWKKCLDWLVPFVIAISGGALSSCGATGAARPISAGETVVTHTERAVSADQVNAIAVPAPLGRRPASASAAADLAAAKLCEYVDLSKQLDLLVQYAAGMTPAARISEPVCQAKK